jgi:hypothetical protein
VSVLILLASPSTFLGSRLLPSALAHTTATQPLSFPLVRRMTVAKPLPVLLLLSASVRKRVTHPAVTPCPSEGTAQMWARMLYLDNIRLLASHELWQINLAM